MFSSVLIIALTTATLSADEVKLRTLDGQTVNGQVAQIEDRKIVLTKGNQEQSFVPSQLHSLTFQDERANARGKVQIALLDGSILHGETFSAAQGRGKVTFGDKSQQEIPIKNVAWVRLREQQGKLAEQWDEYLAEEASSDRLILRRKASSEEKAEASLDVMEGLVGEVSDATVNFEVEGDVIRVKRDRVDGIVYFRGREAALPSPACYVVDTNGSRWAVKTLSWANGKLAVNTPAGLSAELPAAKLQRIDYAAGNLQYLSDLTPDRVARESWLQSGEDASETALFQPIVGHTPEGTVSIGGTVFSRTVWMPAKSSLTVRVPQGFKRFRAQVGIDDRVSATDGARLLVEGEGKVLFDQVIKRDAGLTPLDVDLAGARRVRITVDYGGESFLGDQLVLCEAVFTK